MKNSWKVFFENKSLDKMILFNKAIVKPLETVYWISQFYMLLSLVW